MRNMCNCHNMVYSVAIVFSVYICFVSIVDNVQAEYSNCYSMADCKSNQRCLNAKCRDVCKTDENCPEKMHCDFGICRETTGTQCQKRSDCTDKTQVCSANQCKYSCQTDHDCPSDTHCEIDTCQKGPRIRCLSYTDCGLLQKCVDFECKDRCLNNSDCPTDLKCVDHACQCKYSSKL